MHDKDVLDTHQWRDGCPLIAADEPDPVSILNAGGGAKLLLVGDHVSNRIPRSLDGLGLDDAVLGQHVASDIGTRKLITHLSQHLDAPAVLAGYSRLVVDLNRSLEDPTSIPEVSDGIPIPGNRGLTREERAMRVHCFYRPYRATIDGMLHRFRDRGIVPAFISIHSFTPQLEDRKHRPWQIGLMWDKDPRIPLPMLARLREHPQDIVVGDNEPYSGKHLADYTIDHHAEAAGLPHVSIETRQDLVDTEAGAEEWATILHEALSDILADPGLYRLWDN
ncbi:MAG: N-formylglutamate amidohydrolase [Thiohalobacterales bacterium]|nr:N-formylglutamate amidohydrolase [Thiohalobacterales bacterium]